MAYSNEIGGSAGGGGAGGGAGIGAEAGARGVSRATITGPYRSGNAADFWRMSPRARQVFLKNLGYAVTVDGLSGPQTEDATKAYLAGVSAAAWNKKGMKPGGGTTRPMAPARAAASAAQARGMPVAGSPLTPSAAGIGFDRPVKVPAGANGGGWSGGSAWNPEPTSGYNMGFKPLPMPNIQMPGGPTNLQGILGDLGQLGYTKIDPNDYAATIANLQYDGPIQELIRQRQLAESAGIGAQTSLTDWYKQLTDQLGMSLADMKSNFAGLKGGLDASGKGFINAFGGGANDATGMMGAWADNEVAGLSGLEAASENFDSRMGPIYASQEADAKNAARLTTEQQLANLSAQLVEMQGEKGQAQAAAYYQGLGLNQDMLGNALDMYGKVQGFGQQSFENQLALAKFRQDWQTGQLQNSVAAQNADLAQRLAGYQLAGAGADLTSKNIANQQAALDYTTTTAQFRKWLQDNTGKQAGIVDPTGGKLSAPQTADLSDRLYKSLVNPQTGAPKMGSNAAWSSILTQLRGLGLNPNASGVQNLARMVLKTLFPQVSFGPRGNPVRSH